MLSSYIVFSKDRACQLDLHLRCALKFFKGVKAIYVLYITSNEFYERGYNKLREKMYPKVKWVREINFKKDLLQIFKENNEDYFLTMCDDDCPVREFSFQDLDMIFKNKLIQSFSLRYSEETCFNSVTQTPMNIPQFVSKDKYLIWDWTKQHPRYDWGYPMAVTCTVFKRGDIEPYLRNLKYKNSGQLESQTNHNRNKNKPYMASFKETKVIGLPLNSVIAKINNPHGDTSAKLLNEGYLNDFSIDDIPIVNKAYSKSFFLHDAQVEKIWFDYSEFYKMIVAQNEFKRFVEVGCWIGNSTSFLANLLRNRKELEIYAVDLWDDCPIKYKRPIQNIYDFYNLTLESMGVRHIVRDRKGISWEVAYQFPDKYFDFIFIDADHEYKSVVKDIKAWFPKLRKGGIIAGHDYTTNKGNSVIKVVNECFPEGLKTFHPSIWWYRL